MTQLLLPFVVILTPEGRHSRGVRLEALQQAQDFFEVLSFKAAKYSMSIECFEVVTSNLVQSIAHFTSSRACKGILLFVRDGKGVLLQEREIKAVIEQTAVPRYLLYLPSTRDKHRRVLLRFRNWLCRKQPLPAGMHQDST